MAARVETARSVPDGLKWAAVALLLCLGIGGFYFFGDGSLLLRVVGLLILGGAAALVAAQTEKGRVAWDFVRDSRTEVRKVVWPSRKETLQTTGIVVAMVALVAVFLWLLDSFLGWLVRVLLGHGG